MLPKWQIILVITAAVFIQGNQGQYKFARPVVCMTLKHTAGQFQCLTSTNLSCTSEGSARGRPNTIETRLLFSVTFTCNGTIVGWTVAGKMGAGTLYPELQVWRANTSKGYNYFYKPGQDIPIVFEGSTCELVTQTCGQIFHCRLSPDNHVPVQAGDILGVELPPLSNSGFQLFFIDSVPDTQNHFIYRRQLSSTVTIEEVPGQSFPIIQDQLLVSVEINPGE